MVVLTSLGTWGLPQMVGKFYAIKDEGAIQKGTIISTAFAFVVAGGCYFLGGFGRLYADTAPASFDTLIPTMLSSVEDGLGSAGAWLIGLVLILVLAASMSTLSSLAITSASTITLDLITPLSKKTRSEKTNLLTMRILLGVSVVIAAAIAILVKYGGDWVKQLYISELMGISWGALAGCFLAPFLYGLFWKKVTKPAVYVSFAFGLIITVGQFIINSIIAPKIPGFYDGMNGALEYFLTSSINAGMLAMVVSLILVPVVSLLTQKHVPSNVNAMFACYKKEVTVSVMSSLEEEKK